MFSISREFGFCYGHRLLNHAGKCRRLHGHNGRVRVTLSSDSLNDAGMVRDFSDLKETLGGWIDRTLDHRTLLDQSDPLRERLESAGEQVVAFDGAPTAERLAKLIFDQAAAEGFPVQRVEFWETEKCRAVYEKE